MKKYSMKNKNFGIEQEIKFQYSECPKHLRSKFLTNKISNISPREKVILL